MSNPSDPQFDLSRLSTWRGLCPGMPRAEVVALLTAAGIEDFDDAEDPEWMMVFEWAMDLQFGEDGAQPLRQLAWSDPACTWGGAPLFGQPLHVVLEALGEAAAQAGWRPENAVNHVLEDLEPLEPGEHGDAELLRGGTLWLPVRRLGLVMEDGLLKEVAWRQASDVPRHTTGPVTEAQLELSRSPDMRTEVRFGRPAQPYDRLKQMLTAVFLLALIGIGVFAYQEEQHWQMAPHATATLLSREDEKTRPFRRFFHLEFADAEGVRQTATLQGGDFYVAPEHPGDTAEVTYLSTTPVQVRGPASARNGMFMRCVPLMASAALVYGVLLLVVGWLSTRAKAKA